MGSVKLRKGPAQYGKSWRLLFVPSIRSMTNNGNFFDSRIFQSMTLNQSMSLRCTIAGDQRFWYKPWDMCLERHTTTRNLMSQSHPGQKSRYKQSNTHVTSHSANSRERERERERERVGREGGRVRERESERGDDERGGADMGKERESG